MYRIAIGESEQGSRLDKYLIKYFDGASAAFVYKHLRKKNIKLNGARAVGSERLREGDELTLFFSDGTIAKLSSFFAGDSAAAKEQENEPDGRGSSGNAPSAREFLRESEKGRKKPAASGSRDKGRLDEYCGIVYEDEHIIIADKRAGVLSQKAAPGDYSLNEALLDYVRMQRMQPAREESAAHGRGSSADAGMRPGACEKCAPEIFTPSICNRLDRNTSGLVVFAKTYAAAREMNRLIKERELKKYYLAVVSGNVSGYRRVCSWLTRDSKTNRSRISDRKDSGDTVRIETAFRPMEVDGTNHPGRTDVLGGDIRASLIRVELITGRTHQIRAQMAYLGHPLLGDYKYGGRDLYERLKSRYGIERQLLHAWEIVMPERVGCPLERLSGRSFRAPLPEDIKRVLNGRVADQTFTE